MGHIKEPDGVNFIVDPTPLTEEDKKQISKFIAFYKRTGKKMPIPKSTSRKRVKKATKVDLA